MERDKIKDEVPNESLGEVTRLLGQKWKALSKEEKQVNFFCCCEGRNWTHPMDDALEIL